MSEPDDDDGRGDGIGPLPLSLACERCGAGFEPARFGAATVRDVPPAARCPRCGGDLCEVDPN